MDYVDGELWAVRVGGAEVVRRIHVVFQDHNWHSRPWVIEQEEIEAADDRFSVVVRARGTSTAKEFRWTATIDGAPDGTVNFAFEGSTPRPFWRNRLGLCVLTPLDGLVGQPCTVLTAQGATVTGRFPDAIAPHQPFADIAALEYRLGAPVRIDFTGETFEMEDHRNWGDASYKVYCTPLDLPRPVEVMPGDVVRQSVTVSWPDGPAQPPGFDNPSGIYVGEQPSALPALGVVATPGAWSEAEIADLAALGLEHLYAVIDLAGVHPERALHEAATHARAIGARLRVALRDGGAGALATFAPAVRELADLVDCWYLFRSDEPVTSAAWIAAARTAFGADIPLGGGTDVYFTELNREPPSLEGIDWINVPITPQQHSCDDRTIIQSPAALAAIAANLPRLAGSTPVSVSPLTLRRRVNPYAADPASDISNDSLPPSVDFRQRTWFAGAWLAVALRSLAIPGTVSVVTCFEALGWRGIRESDAGSADEESFPSSPGERFPAYDVLMALRGFDRVLPTQSGDPEAYDALVVTDGQGMRAIAVNFTDADLTVPVTGTVSASLDLPARSVTVHDIPGGTP